MPATIPPTTGARLHYEERGSGAPILCIHGTGSSALAWAPAILRLARHGRVIAYDRRGFSRSRSAAPGGPLSVADHADDAAALLSALGATPAVVIGRSYGGSVALDLALRYPAYVRALVLLEGVPESLDPEAERWVRGVAERTLAAGARGPAAAAETLFREVLGDDGWSGLPDETRRMFLDNGPAILAELRGGWLPDLGPADLARIGKPALLVAATDSPPAFRRVHDVAAAAMPNARTALVGGGHLIDPAGPAVLAFLEEVGAQASSGTSQSPERGGNVSLAEKG
jgi:pimeloyl-ACP methyl ester carboxylesterase